MYEKIPQKEEREEKIMRKIKRIVSVLFSAVSLMAMAIPVNADTTAFYVTAHSDLLSPQVYKSKEYYENRAYVTATYFSFAGSFQCTSVCHSNVSIISHDMYVSGSGGYTGENSNAKDNKPYRVANPPASVTYFLSVSSNSNGLYMEGRFTP